MIRLLDILISSIVLLISFPLFIITSILIKVESHGPIFFVQTRVGKDNLDFTLYKFRTMILNSEKIGQLTIGERDPRITKVGYYLRKYKIDEFAQLINVLKGDMSIVGPRPEIRKYVDSYNDQQRIILSVRPGITDFASIKYIRENEILSHSTNPELTYLEEIMPAKISLNMSYINNPSIGNYLKVLFLTIKNIIQIR
ncbi:MAG TPA: sugar transferase [Bacteroidales bacterium]|nr:sugar transferase [Bacteroidales bacterium]